MSKNLQQVFIDAAQRKDIPYLRSFITSEIIYDPTFDKSICDDCMEYLAKCGLDITESFKLDSTEKPTPTDRSMWDKDLFLDKVEFLRTNFAYKERIDELRNIGRVAYADEIIEEKNENFVEAPRGRRSEKKNASLAAMIGAVTAVAAIIAVIAMLIKK